MNKLLRYFGFVGIFAVLMLAFAINAYADHTPAHAGGDDIEEDDTDSCDENIAPMVELNGDEEIVLTVGDSYDEQGAQATEEEDGQLSVEIKGETVDTETPGHYLLKYGATDSCGETTVVYRKVIVMRDELFNNPPEIILNGPAFIKLFLGAIFLQAVFWMHRPS